MPRKKAALTRAARREDAAKAAAPETKHAGGRPTKYDAKYCEEILEYFDPAKNLTLISINKDGTPNLAAFPLLAGFAWKLGVSRDTLHEWAKRHPEFSDAYARAREAQEVILATGGLNGAYNATFATLTAKNILGWRDKTDLEHATKPGDPIIGLLGAIAASSDGGRFKPGAKK